MKIAINGGHFIGLDCEASELLFTISTLWDIRNLWGFARGIAVGITDYMAGI